MYYIVHNNTAAKFKNIMKIINHYTDIINNIIPIQI